VTRSWKPAQKHVEDPVQMVQAVPNWPHKSNGDPAAPNTDIFVDSAVIFYTIQIDYEEER